MSAKNLNFNAPLQKSSYIFIDSSFLLNVITQVENRQTKFKEDCNAFLARLKKEMTPLDLCLVTSDFVISEVLYKIIKDELQVLIDKKKYQGIFMNPWIL